MWDADRGRLYEAETARVMFAAFNFANPNSPISGALDDPNLRRALTLAIDRQALAADVFGGFARRSRQDGCPTLGPR
jgi:ABC-type oligopeptide transport system substrate-binding subunit